MCFLKKENLKCEKTLSSALSRAFVYVETGSHVAQADPKFSLEPRMFLS